MGAQPGEPCSTKAPAGRVVPGSTPAPSSCGTAWRGLCIAQGCSAAHHLPTVLSRQGGQADAGDGRARQSRKPPRGKRQSRSHHRWQRGARNKKYNRFIRLNLECESLPLHSAEPGQGESRSTGAAPRLALAKMGVSDRPGAQFGLQWKPRPAYPSAAVLRMGCRGARAGSGLQSCGGPPSTTRLGRGGGETGRGRRGAEQLPAPPGSSPSCVSCRMDFAQLLCLHPPPREHPSSLLEHRARTSASSAAGTRQPPGFLREELNIDEKLVTLLCPPLSRTLPHQTSLPPGKSRVFHSGTASARHGAS